MTNEQFIEIIKNWLNSKEVKDFIGQEEIK